MKTRSRDKIFGLFFRIDRRRRKHDPMLLLSMSLFNFSDGWSRTFAKETYARAWF